MGDNMDLRKLYIEYFISKGHKYIPSAPVVPENNSNVLFNTAGMQPLIPYLLGKKHLLGNRLVNYQMCIRTSDLDEVGDKTHHTFFEMLGNWSLGDYFKKESINYSYEFLTKILKIPHEKLAVSVFEGDKNIPRDIVSAKAWEDNGISKDKIVYLGVKDNFWIAGEYGPCGGDTEIFYFNSEDETPSFFDPEDNRWVEIWNNVFMEYNKSKDGIYTELPNKNVDTGMGLERVVALLEGHDDNYKSSLWIDIINKISEISNLPYQGNEKSMRIIADHIKASVFILADNSFIKPSNTDQGYILRRLIRRAIRHARILNIDNNTSWEAEIANIVIDKYHVYYKELLINKEIILNELKIEKERFNKTLEKGLKEFSKVINNSKDIIGGKDAFKLYDTYGFPLELTVELAKEENLKVDIENFKERFKEHQEKSRSGAQAKFKGGLANDSENVIKLHTATHLLNAALKVVVDPNISQKGSNITEERLRFDFNHNEKVTKEQQLEIEKLVNKWINDKIDVEVKEMDKEEALKIGAECLMVDKYPDKVNVYFIGDISKEFCGGPHVKNTGELGEFKIIKEEASSAGIRRIKAVLK